MILKTLLFFTVTLATIFQAVAQRQNVYLLKNSGKVATSRDSADFIRIVREPDPGSAFYNVLEYYMSGTPKLIGKSSQIEYLVLEGQCVRYYPSGKRKELANYSAGKLLGEAYENYPNGVLYCQKRYLVNKAMPGTDYYNDYQTIACNDSTGKALATEGNGYFIGYNDSFNKIEEEGNIKVGLRDGDWKGTIGAKDNPITFNEKYEVGKMVSGQAKTTDGAEHIYTIREMPPQFKGGESAFGRFLGNHIRYPELSRFKGIQGKVLISFVVEKDGSLTDLKTLKSPSDDLGQEATRVLQESPKWIPGTQCGMPIRVQFTVPINFSLGGQ